MADFQQNAFNAINQGFNFGQQVKAVQDQKRINQLASQGYGAPQQDRQGLLGQIAKVDARAAQQQEQAFANSDERRNTTLANMARILTSAPDQARPGLYQQMLPTLSSFGMSDLPQEYNAETAPIINQAADSIASAYGGGGSGVQSTYINRQGQRVAVMRDGSQQVLGEADARTQLRDQPGVAPSLINLRTAEATPLQAGQIQQQGANGAYTIDPSLPPEVQAQIRAAESAGVEYGGANSALVAPRTDPSQVITPYQQIQLDIERQRLASSEAERAAERERRENPSARELAPVEQSLRKEFNDLTKDARVVVNSYNQIRSAAQNPSAQNDLALIFSYMRMLDPGSVVREGEFATAQNAAGVDDRVRNQYNRIISGERLNPDQRKGFVQSAETLRAGAQKRIDDARGEYSGLAGQYGLSPERVTGGSGSSTTAGSGPVRVNNEAEYEALPSGATYLDPQGNQRRKR